MPTASEASKPKRSSPAARCATRVGTDRSRGPHPAVRLARLPPLYPLLDAPLRPLLPAYRRTDQHPAVRVPRRVPRRASPDGMVARGRGPSTSTTSVLPWTHHERRSTSRCQRAPAIESILGGKESPSPDEQMPVSEFRDWIMAPRPGAATTTAKRPDAKPASSSSTSSPTRHARHCQVRPCTTGKAIPIVAARA